METGGAPSRPAGWWETAFGLWRWRDVERLAASEAAGGSQAVVAEASGVEEGRWLKAKEREGRRSGPLDLDRTVKTVTNGKKQITVYKLSLAKQKPN